MGSGKSTRGRLLAALLGGAVLAGCGGGETDAGTAAPPVPPQCLDRWNDESASQTFGRHAYSEHDARRALVTELEPGRGSVNVRGSSTCAVVFTVPESDPEYGDVGLVVTRFGWASMTELARGDSERLKRIQDSARVEPNAAVFPDGTVQASS